MMETATDFREAMASYPSGVAIITTVDENGRWWGFTGTSFCSVSMEPPLVLVCLAKTAECHAAFARAPRWTVNVVPNEHVELARRFATRGADKFRDGGFCASATGVPALPGGSMVLECSAHARYAGGYHSILLGRVENVNLGEAHPTVYFRRRFHALRATPA
jgi:flavin reductase ActVB